MDTQTPDYVKIDKAVRVSARHGECACSGHFSVVDVVKASTSDNGMRFVAGEGWPSAWATLDEVKAAAKMFQAAADNWPDD